MKSHTRLRHVKVLVVDDNAISRRFTVEALRQTAGGVKQAGSGAEAVACALAYLPDFIYMDLQLQDMSGLDALHLIRDAWPAGLKPPGVILQTADRNAAENLRAANAGIEKVLLKPVSVGALLAPLSGAHAPGCSAAKQPHSLSPALRGMFASELRKRLPELDSSLAGRQWRAAGALLHQLIGSSAICGEPHLERAARTLGASLTGDVGIAETAQAYYDFLLAAEDVRRKAAPAPTPNR